MTGKTIKRRTVTAQAVKFTGKNGKDVSEFVNEFYGRPVSTTRGPYVNLDAGMWNQRVVKGNWVVIDSDFSLRVYDEATYKRLFLTN